MIMMKMMRLKRIVWMMPVCGTRTDADATVNGLVANLTNVVASVGMVFVFMITAQKHVESASKNYFSFCFVRRRKLIKNIYKLSLIHI